MLLLLLIAGELDEEKWRGERGLLISIGFGFALPNREASGFVKGAFGDATVFAHARPI